MSGLPQLSIRVVLYPKWNGGWTVFNEAEQGWAFVIGFLAVAIQWVPAVPCLSLACVSCGEICDLRESSKEAVRQRAWTKGWLVNEKEEWFCQHCRQDQEPNPHVIAAIYRRFGGVKELNA